jgi:hypothetical protein
VEKSSMICRCTHDESFHAYGRVDGKKIRTSCTAQENFKFCKCEEFRPISENQIEGENMRKKTVSRKSNLLYFANEAKLKAFDDGRLLDKKEKNYTAVIAQALVDAGKEGLEFEKLVSVVGKVVKTKNEKTLRNNIRWYLSSKRSDVAKFVTSERAESEAPKKAAKKAKAPRKPRAKKQNGASTTNDITDADLRELEAAPF